jgi:5-oxopent-3-ene-1,2,5-tricarboxylate decarboxylase/2-hydroxyhepta-2,4-diene-1,7-dioate isomerase
MSKMMQDHMNEPTRRGTVYGTLFNHRDALDALGGAVDHPPYKGAPKAPVLYIKPRNAVIDDGEAIVVPEGVDELEIGATLGLVIGKTACRVQEEEALSFVAGYVIVNDVSIPHSSYYRPSLRFKARDTFCPIGPFRSRAALESPDRANIEVLIDDRAVHRASTRELIRPASKLLADVTEFMTLSPGDILSVGVAAGAPRVRAGQQVGVKISGLGVLENYVCREGATT